MKRIRHLGFQYALLCFTSAILVLSFSMPVFAAAPRWIDGVMTSHSHLNCITQKVEALTTEYVGYWGTVDLSYPKVGDLYYGHVVVGTVGNSCAGGADVQIKVELPANTYPYFTDLAAGTVDTRCYITSLTTGASAEVTNEPSSMT